MDPTEIKDSDAMEVTIVTPEQIVFHGKVKVLSLSNKLGPFDVMPYHETFISLIDEKLTIYPLDGAKQELEVDKGVLRVHKNMVDIFLGLDTISQ